MSKTITFFGASGGCGYYALKAALADGHTCVCLLRVPSKLADLASQYPAQLVIREGNAHSVDDVAATLVHPHDASRLVDAVCTSIGNKPDPSNWGKSGATDWDVCKKGASALVGALSRLRAQDARYGGQRPLVAVVSTTGLRGKRDYPLAFYPLYQFMLAQPHADKKVMEERLRDSAERYALVRPSLLVDEDPDKVEKKKAKGKYREKEIRVGVEDAKTGAVESEEIGYTITRPAVGRWLYDNLLMGDPDKVEGKAYSITF